uniref:hypothetical protein n=1 Tax=Flavobacterium sp. TaxID=239 RepID=UPI00404B5318
MNLSITKITIILISIFGTQFLHAQFFKNYCYYEGEVGGITSFFVKDADGETQIMTLGGLSFRGGLGIHNEENSLFFGIHSGIEGNFRHETGILPVYLNSKVALEVDDETFIILAFGYGKSFQIGTENYKGFLRKYTIGLAGLTRRGNMNTLFIEVNNHGFYFPDGVRAVTLNIGLTFSFL